MALPDCHRKSKEEDARSIASSVQFIFERSVKREGQVDDEEEEWQDFGSEEEDNGTEDEPVEIEDPEGDVTMQKTREWLLKSWKS